MSEWCCVGFEEYFHEAGKRGLAVFAVKSDSYGFVLQHRSMDRGQARPTTDVPLSLVTDTYIQYCPWCGVRLIERYRNMVKKLDRTDLKMGAGIQGGADGDGGWADGDSLSSHTPKTSSGTPA